MIAATLIWAGLIALTAWGALLESSSGAHAGPEGADLPSTWSFLALAALETLAYALAIVLIWTAPKNVRG